MPYTHDTETALRCLRAHTTRPVYAAAVIRTEYPDGIPAALVPVHKACLAARGSWSGVDAAMRALDGAKVAA